MGLCSVPCGLPEVSGFDSLGSGGAESLALAGAGVADSSVGFVSLGGGGACIPGA